MSVPGQCEDNAMLLLGQMLAQLVVTAGVLALVLVASAGALGMLSRMSRG
jgi:hypothetical protein